MNKSLLCVGSALLCLSIVGCGDSGPVLGTVTGTITLDGDPVENAFVEFHPQFEGGQIMYSKQKSDADGYYEMQFNVDRMGVPVGNYQVQVSTYDMDKQPDGSNKVVKERMPAHYIGYESILTYEVLKGDNDASFELTKKKPK